MKYYRNTFLAFLSVCILAGLAVAQDTGRAMATWQVQKYDLDVVLPQEESGRTVTVKAILNLKNISGRPANSLTLRISPAAVISAVKINDTTVDHSKSEEKINTSSSLQRAAIRFASVPPDALLSATVDYKINLKENSALMSLTPNRSQFLPLSFWYPTPNSWYFTRGADQAPVRLKVHTAGGQTVVSSGAETAGGFDQTLYAQPFFAAGSWDISDQNGVAVYMPKGTGADGQKRAAELAALLAEAKVFTAGLLGKGPDVQFKIVSSRRGAGYASAGTVFVNDSAFHRAKTDSQTAMNIAEAAAKLWIGNAVSVNGEAYGVVGEGLARYIATQFIESKFGKDVADIERLSQRNSYAAVSKRDSPLNIVSPLDDYYYPEVANKGAMVWRILAKRLGPTEFFKVIRENMQDRDLNVAELRSAFSSQKDLLDYLFDQVTDMNLLVGLPQESAGSTKVAIRNTGASDVTVDVTATTASGEKITTSSSIRATSFGEVSFKSNAKITKVEIDSDKLYPQTDYSDDIAPRTGTDSDPLLTVKRFFDKQDFANAESSARAALRDLARYDEIRVLLGRSLLAQNKVGDAEKEFRAVLDEKLPTARGLAWANVGLADASVRSNQTGAALKYAEAAILTDGDYGASLTARNLRNRAGAASALDAGVKAFFADFDKAAAANRKADVDLLVMPGEVTKFAGGVSGSTEQWQTQVRQIDRLDAETVLVEANMTVKLLNKDIQTGLAVFRIVKTGSGWKLSAVEMFEL